MKVHEVNLEKKEVKVKPFFLLFLYLYRGGSTKQTNKTQTVKGKKKKRKEKKNDKPVTGSKANTLVNSVQKEELRLTNTTPLPLPFFVLCKSKPYFSFSFSFFFENIERKRIDQSQRAPASLRRGTRVPLI